MKGIILAGGAASRLYPATLGVSKQVLPVFDKPMIYYPLSVLMLAGLQDILIISTPRDTPVFAAMLGDGSAWGLSLSYEVQDTPRGLADAFIVGRDFIGGDQVCLILGDNLFYGAALSALLGTARQRADGATIFCQRVADPERFGVVELDDAGIPFRIVEKPTAPRSNWAVTGLYMYDNSVLEIAASLSPSPRGEIEITDINSAYMKAGTLHAELLGRGYAWLDTGTHESLLEASEFVKVLEHRQGLKIACLEEIAFHNGWISFQTLRERGEMMKASTYGRYLLSLDEHDPVRVKL